MALYIPNDLRRLIGKPACDPSVEQWLASMDTSIERIEDEFYSEAISHGVSVRYELADPATDVASVSWEQLVVSAIQLHADGHEGFAQYAGDLPLGFLFGEHLDRAARLPEPARGSPERIAGEKPRLTWRKWYVDSMSVHAQYNAAGNLEMISIEARPRQ